MHVAETPFELENSLRRFGKKDLEFLESIGFLGPDVLAVHCVHLDARDLRILKALDVKVSHNPTSNMHLSSGVAPVPAMLVAGIAVGLASDGPASNNTHNMIQAMKLAALLHKVVTRDPTIITPSGCWSWRRSTEPGRSGWRRRLARWSRASGPT